MFEFFFKYPMPVFTKGKFVLLGAWPGWVLLLLIVASVARSGVADLVAAARGGGEDAARGARGRSGCCSLC